MKATTIEINLELQLDGDTVSGRAHSADGSVREFSGWIGLMGLVDSLLDGARSDGASTIEREAPGEAGSNGAH